MDKATFDKLLAQVRETVSKIDSSNTLRINIMQLSAELNQETANLTMLINNRIDKLDQVCNFVEMYSCANSFSDTSVDDNELEAINISRLLETTFRQTVIIYELINRYLKLNEDTMDWEQGPLATLKPTISNYLDGDTALFIENLSDSDLSQDSSTDYTSYYQELEECCQSTISVTKAIDHMYKIRVEQHKKLMLLVNSNLTLAINEGHCYNPNMTLNKFNYLWDFDTNKYLTNLIDYSQLLIKHRIHQLNQYKSLVAKAESADKLINFNQLLNYDVTFDLNLTSSESCENTSSTKKILPTSTNKSPIKPKEKYSYRLRNYSDNNNDSDSYSDTSSDCLPDQDDFSAKPLLTN
jgi:hypothetical protein